MPIKNRAAKPPGSILITGASSGIGEALAYRYAAPGITLFLSGRNADRLRKVAETCRQRGAIVDDRTIDVCNAQEMQIWIESADQQSPLDLVIANAGISGGTADGDEDAEQIRQIFEVNLNGMFNTILPVLPLMRARGRGQIALMASLAAFRGWPGAPAYGAAKGAVRIYGEGLRGAVAASGIRINVISPGFVKSRMTETNNYVMPFLMDSEKAARIIVKGLAKNRGRIAFPCLSYALVVLISVLPGFICDNILVKLPRKHAMQKYNAST